MSFTSHFIINPIKKIKDNPIYIFNYPNKLFQYIFYNDKLIEKYNEFTFIDKDDTLNEIINNYKSLLRIGDSEPDFIVGGGVYYNDWHQSFNPKLRNKLIKILKKQNKKILYCFNYDYFLKKKKNDKTSYVWIQSKMILYKYMYKNIKYGPAHFFSQLDSEDFIKLKNFLKDKDIIIVTNNTKRFKDISFGRKIYTVECPKSDAWDKYDEIIINIKKIIKNKKLNNKNTIIFTSLATSSKIMVSDLTKLNFQTIDSGQFFDLFLEKINLKK
jgi:hypothetical protein